MKKLAIILSVALLNCAYGDPNPEQPVYGHRDPNKDNGYTDGGTVSYNNGDTVPHGCIVEEIKEVGQLPMFWVLCPDNPQMAYKWLVDPPPDGK